MAKASRIVNINVESTHKELVDFMVEITTFSSKHDNTILISTVYDNEDRFLSIWLEGNVKET